MRTVPKKLVSKIDWACSIELSSAPAGVRLNPALLTSKSMRPSQRITSSVVDQDVDLNSSLTEPLMQVDDRRNF
jgi:hypothetical protein